MNTPIELVSSPSQLQSTREAYDIAFRKMFGDLPDDTSTPSTGFNNPLFDGVRKKINETLLFQTNSFELQDGVEQCRKCGSYKTLSSAKQTRSADEGATGFTQCLKCKHRSVKNS